MAAGLVFGIATGFSWRVSLWTATVLLGGYYATMMADAGALAAGAVVGRRAPSMRGATLGVYSMLGFGAGLFAPTAFGVILDLAGGAQSGWAWAAAFAVLAVPNVDRHRGPAPARRRADAGRGDGWNQAGGFIALSRRPPPQRGKRHPG